MTLIPAGIAVTSAAKLGVAADAVQQQYRRGLRLAGAAQESDAAGNFAA